MDDLRLALPGNGQRDDTRDAFEVSTLPPLGHDGNLAVFEIHADLLVSREVLPAEHVLARSRLVDLS